MSKYDNPDKDNLYEEINEFLNDYSVGTLMEIIADILKGRDYWRGNGE